MYFFLFFIFFMIIKSVSLMIDAAEPVCSPIFNFTFFTPIDAWITHSVQTAFGGAPAPSVTACKTHCWRKTHVIAGTHKWNKTNACLLPNVTMNRILTRFQVLHSFRQAKSLAGLIGPSTRHLSLRVPPSSPSKYNLLSVAGQCWCIYFLLILFL